MWKRFKAKIKAAWLKTRAWAYALLVSLGIFVAIPVEAIPTAFTYTRATEYTDLTPMPLAEIKETRLYCNGSLTVTELGADGDFLPDLVPGTYDGTATHVDIYDRESGPSNTVQKVVLPGLPNPPVLN